MKKILMLGVVALFISCTSTDSKTKFFKDSQKDFTIIHVNDFHGKLDAKGEELGYAKISGFVEKVREEDETLYVSSGDMIQGSIYTTTTRGEAMILPMNMSKLDIMTLGNHEFDYGQERLKALSEKMNFKIVSTNVKNKSDGSTLFNNVEIRTIDGIKVGIFGITTPETATATNPKNIEKLKFEDIVTSSQKAVKYLKEQNVDVVIGLTHLGVEGAETSMKLAKEVPEIDLIIDGHSHTRYNEKIGNTYIVQAGKYGEVIGTVKVAKEKDGIKITPKQYKKEDLQEVPENQSVKAEIEKIKIEIDNQNAEKIGKTSVLLNGERESVRGGETNLGNLIADSFLKETGADIAIINGGGIRASVKSGDITRKDIITVLPFENKVVTINLTGEEIKQALEHGFKEYPKLSGAYPHFGGMKVEIAPKNPVGSRVISIKIKGTSLNMKKVYKVATNDFLGNGGDGYTVLAKKVTQEWETADQVLINYIKSNGVKETVDNRLKIRK